MKVEKNGLLDALLGAGHIDEELYGIIMYLPLSKGGNLEYFNTMTSMIEDDELTDDQIIRISALDAMLVIDMETPGEYVRRFEEHYTMVKRYTDFYLDREADLDKMIEEARTEIKTQKPLDIL